MPQEPIFFNGQWSHSDSVKISPFDRGYLFGDGIYEVIPVYNSRPFRLPEHLRRLMTNLKLVDIPIVYSMAKIEEIIQQSINQQPTGNYYVYLQITRGVQNPRDFCPSGHEEPQMLVYLEKLKPVDNTVIEQGIQVGVVEDPRWRLCHIKSLNLLGSALMRKKARSQDLDDMLFIRDDCLSEATAGNLFVVVENTVLTPPLSHNILAGVTRSYCIEQLNESPWDIEESNIPVSLLPKITCAWISSSTKELQPISTIFHEQEKFPLDHKHEAFIWMLQAFHNK